MTMEAAESQGLVLAMLLEGAAETRASHALQTVPRLAVETTQVVERHALLLEAASQKLEPQIHRLAAVAGRFLGSKTILKAVQLRLGVGRA
jgi:poly-gamma-glutamate capsule biosynthesis protein CapA/YwtB (metallophosphatase superfamily)